MLSFIEYLKVENSKIISQIVRISKVYDQHGERVSKNDKSCHICSTRLKRLFAKYEKFGTLSIQLHEKTLK